jgi:hypothetical protein
LEVLKFLWPSFWFFSVLALFFYEVSSVNGESALLFDRDGRSIKIKDPESKISKVDWGRVWLRLETETGWHVGTPFTVNESCVYIFDEGRRFEPFVSLPMPYYQSAFSVCKIISCFMKNDPESIDGIVKKTKRKVWPHIFDSGLSHFRDYIINNRMKKGLFLKIGWGFVSLLTLGPVPYWFLEAVTQFRFRHASRTFLEN